MPDEPTQPPATKSTPRTRRRWAKVRRFFAVLGALVLLLLILVQIFLWTDYPRKIAISQIQKSLGLRAEIASLHIAWFGKSRVEGLKLDVPMTGGSFVKVKSIQLKHPSLFAIAFNPSVDSVKLDDVEIALRQEVDGRWNVQQITPAPSDSSSRPVLDIPDIEARDIRVQIFPSNQKPVTLDRVSIVGKQTAALEYQLTANVGNEIALNSTLALNVNLEHTIGLKVSALPPAIAELIKKPDLPLQADLSWKGRRSPTGVIGSLSIAKSNLAGIATDGDASIFTTAEKTVVFEPEGLHIRTINATPIDLKLNSGKVVIGKAVQIEQLRGEIGAGKIAATGKIDLATMEGNVSAAWESIVRGDFGTSGRLRASMRKDFTGKQIAEAVINGNVILGDDRGEGELTLRAEGESLEAMRINIESKPFSLHLNDRAVIAPSLLGEIESVGQKFVLRSLRPRDASAGVIEAQGEFDRKTNQWWTSLHAQRFNVGSTQISQKIGQVDIELNAFGDLRMAQIDRLYAKRGGMVAWARGFYDTQKPAPVNLETWLWYNHSPDPRDDAMVRGVVATGTVSGTVSPRRLVATASLGASDFSIRGRQFGDLSAKVVATLKRNRIDIESEQMEILGGKWTLVGGQNLRWREPFELNISWRDLPLERVSDLLKSEKLSGIVERGELRLKIPSARIAEWNMSGELTARRPTFGEIEADRIVVPLYLEDGTLRALPTITRNNGSIASEISLDLPLAERVQANFELKNFPLPAVRQKNWSEPLLASLSGTARATYETKTKSIEASTNLEGPILRADKTVGDLNLSARLSNDSLTIESANLRTLDGSATAKGEVNLKKLNSANLQVELSRLQLSELAWLESSLEDTRGRLSGTITMKPSEAPRALGPARIEIKLRPESLRFREIEAGQVDVVAYADYSHSADFRIVTERAKLYLGKDGVIEPFLRISKSPEHGMSRHLTATFSKIDLEPISKSFEEQREKPLVGFLAGDVTVFGPTAKLRDTTAELQIRITDSDLANFGPLSALYNYMRLGTAGREPQGAGSAVVRLEQGNLNLVNATYRNRGIYANGFGSVEDLDKGKQARNNAVVVGSAQLLGNLIPGGSDADKIFGVLQGAITTVRVTGTIGKPEYVPAALGELGDTFRGVLLGKARAEREQSR